jgi:transglutaminase-like putative cysteine protease
MVEGEHQAAARDWTRIVLIVGCVLAALTAAMLVPSLASDGIAGSPVDSVLPGERFDDGKGQGGFGDGNGFGALNPGDSTGVGGDTGFDKDTFGNNDTEVHFQVESSESAYWRTGTYGTYTGTGWERDVERMSYGGPIGDGGLGGDRVVYEVEFERPATALPTAWRPTSVSGLTGLEVTETGSVISGETVEPGTSFSAISQQPVRDVDVLQAAGGDYPDDVEDRYTQLPDDTPERVGDLTEELTGDDETAYEAARSIQSWLRTEKGYSLQASRQSDHMADTFIFEMEEGYCEYFATAMTTMLRTQGIPARYTVGYTTGQEVENNRYEVRGMNAHAWVEVYFPDVGWVRFDPTPGGSRLEAQQEALESQQPDLEYNATEEGSPGEVFRPGEVTETETVEQDNNDSREGQTGDGYFDVSLNRTAVPGAPVEVTVTAEGDPVPSVAVLFDGERVGVTGSEGTVTAVVPGTEKLRIELAPPDRESDADAAGGGFLNGADTLAAPADRAGLLDGLQGGAGSGSPGSLASQTDENTTVIDVETDAAVSVSGDGFAGEEVGLTATVADVTIGGAAVFVNGERVAETDADGRATVVLPEEPGNVTLAVERGPIFGQTEIRVPVVDLEVDAGLLAVPLTGATVELTADGEGIADAPVAVDGTDVTRTGPDGTATVRLPVSTSATISTTTAGLRREARVDGLVRNALLALLTSALVIGLPAGVAYRRGYRPRDVESGVRTAVGWGRRALVVVVRGGLRAVTAVSGRASKTLVYLAEFASGAESVAGLWMVFRGWLRAKGDQVAGLVPQRTDRDTANSGPDTDAQPVDVPTVREAWDRFVAALDVPDPETKTPGELATYAIEEAELPQDPVETLRDAFRDVEYGDQSSADSDDALLAAIERIEDRAAEPGDARDTNPGGEAAAERDETAQEPHDWTGTDSVARGRQ